ncbi:MAG: glycosyltransferase [Halieaceae bacterium]|nr:glycosyltransferase [Halieaceae bacterium]
MGKNTVAVIVTFNRLDALKVTLDNTLKQAFYKVVIVNNCSTDGTGDWLDGLDENRLIITHCKENQGSAGGFRWGFVYAAEKLQDANWLVCFDDDAYPEKGMLEAFQAIDIAEDVGGVAAAVYLPSGQISEMNRPSLNPFWHVRTLFSTIVQGRQGFHIDDAAYVSKLPREVDASSFVGFFVRLSLIRERQINLPRAELFIYADDVIFALEMRKAGFKHLFVPTLKFRHDCQTLIEHRDVYYPLWRVYYTFRNRLEMYRVTAGIFFPAVLLVKIPEWLFNVRYYKANERPQFLKIATKAIWDGLRRNYSLKHEQVAALGNPPG